MEWTANYAPSLTFPDFSTGISASYAIFPQRQLPRGIFAVVQ